ncbi:hypothetical protein IT417_02130 [bacterium]|nr:hypothetical protein [bacterium]
MEFANWLLAFSIPKEVLEILIIIPILATLISIGRYVIGLKTLGIYAPIALAIAYKMTGLRYGLALTFLVIIASLIGYRFLSKVRMHYTTRVAANYTLLSILVITGIITFDSIPFLGLNNFNQISPVGVVLIATLSDFFIKAYIKKSLFTSMRVLLETLLISVIGWYIIRSPNIIELIFHNLWIIPLLVAVNLLLGRYRGFRLKEVLRFQTIPNDADTRTNKS